MRSLAIGILLAFVAGCNRPGQEATEIHPNAEVAETGVSPTSGSATDEVPFGDPSQENVVIAAAVFPPQARRGDVVTLALRFRAAAGWHFFAVASEDQAGPILPTRLDLDLPAGVSFDGDWDLPEPELYDGPTGRSRGYSGDVTFRRRLRIDAGHSPGVLKLRLTVSYQACNDSFCTRPAPAELRPTLDVIER